MLRSSPVSVLETMKTSYDVSKPISFMKMTPMRLIFHVIDLIDLRRPPPTVHGFSYNVINRARGSAAHLVFSNIFSLSIVSCGASVFLFYMFGMVTPFMDKVLAFGESAVMFYLGGPTASALAKLLLQTTPDVIRSGMEARLSEVTLPSAAGSTRNTHIDYQLLGRFVKIRM